MSATEDTPRKRRPPGSTLAKAEREGFRDRLLQILKARNMTASPTKLTKLFIESAPGADINAQSVRKWLLGHSMPTQDKLRILANLLGTSAEWLRYGEQTRSAASLALLASIESMSYPWQTLAVQVIQVLAHCSKTHTMIADV